MTQGVFIGEATRRWIVAQLAAGRKQVRIAAEAGVSETTVSLINVAIRGPKETPEQRVLIHKLLDDGLSVAAIASQAEVSKTRVRKAKGRLNRRSNLRTDGTTNHRG